MEEETPIGELESPQPKREELIIEAKKFFDSYKEKLGDSLRKGKNVIYLDFMTLTEFSTLLSDNSDLIDAMAAFVSKDIELMVEDISNDRTISDSSIPL